MHSQSKVWDFATSVQKTQESLAALAEHWESQRDGAPLVTELRRLLAAPDKALTEEAYAWAQAAGLRLLPPAEAVNRCHVAPQNLPRDGLATLFQAELGAEPPHGALLVAPAPGCGFGVFATSKIKKGTHLGEYTGEVCRYNLWMAEVLAKKKRARGPDAGNVPFIPDELYAAWSGDGPNGEGTVVDAFSHGNAMRFVNCSCGPNASFKSFGGLGIEGYKRLRMVALRDIEPWEQLSVDYGWYHDEQTNKDCQAEAVAAYAADRAELQSILQGSAVSASASSAARAVASAVAGTLDAARGNPETYLHRFISDDEVRTLATQGVLPDAASLADIPSALRRIYEISGAARVGIACMCALDPSLNFAGRCSGIIGLRPNQC